MVRHDPGRQDGAPAGLGVLLGADGVTGRRSGIGRVTLEVARALRNPGKLADLALLIGDAVSPPDILDRAAQAADAPPCRTRAMLAHARIVASRCPTAVALHAWRLRRLLDHAARDMARRIGGKVVYHESNLIARPFDGATVVMMHDLAWRAHPALHPPERVAWI
jgi:hypothetical protein